MAIKRFENYDVEKCISKYEALKVCVRITVRINANADSQEIPQLFRIRPSEASIQLSTFLTTFPGDS